MNFPRTFAAGLFSFALVMLFVAPSPTLAEVDRTPLKTLEADVTKHRVSGGFAECGSNTSLTRGSYRVKLKSIDVK
ncbi:MAG: hypothetical protein IT461_17030, partial [Planctomycetes bacterium]|nr:hypothetical protein [Planctomycetota bacterium]